jgi:LPS export ABC transporter protein LptC
MIALSMIYFLFEPMNLKQTKDQEVPQFSLEKFTMHELDQNGLITKMDGESALRYTNRYVVDDIDYTDNSKEFLTNMKAKKGIYKNNIVYLSGDVKLLRDDGVKFFSQKLTYNKVKDTAYNDVEYIAYMGPNSVKGKSVFFDNKKGLIRSKDIDAVYKLEEENR